VANGSGAWSASVPPALSAMISAWALGQTLMPARILGVRRADDAEA